MSTSKVRTAGTLVVLATVVAVMLVLGWQAVNAPFPSLGGDSSTTACKKEKVKRTIFRREISVSVYNATQRKGLADDTMASMERRSFKPGVVGNAPAGTKVSYVQVRSTTPNDPAALLVARQFKPVATVILADDDLGPGVDVVLGKRFTRMHVPAPKSLRLAKPITTCLDNTGVGVPGA